jgi:hypothetical protein
VNNTTTQNKKTKQSVVMASIAMVIALALVASPIVAMDDVLATKKKKGNWAEQFITQSQSSNQNGLCVSGGSTLFSCNNTSFQNQFNSGNNALAQKASGNGGNLAEQGISQSQSSSQNSFVVSGGDTIGSGNNFNSQTQVNTGSNAAAQS